MMPTKDLSLLLTVLATEEASMKRIYKRRLTAILARYDEDDLFGDVQLRAIRDWNSCTSTDLDGVRKWVRVIARNLTVTMLERHIGCGKRSIKREVMGEPSEKYNECANLQQCATYDDDDRVELEEQLQVCRDAVATLPTRQAEAIQRRILDEVEYGEIATEMAISAGAARTLVSRGIASCRERVGEYSEPLQEGIANDQANKREKVQRC